MSYEDFEIEQIENEFEIEVVDVPGLFKDIKPREPIHLCSQQ